MVKFNEFIADAKAKCESKHLDVSSVDWLIMDLFGWNRTEMIMKYNEEPTIAQRSIMKDAFNRLYKGEPIQYIVGFQSFYGETFRVNKHCLIPRPETEEVMLHFLNELNDNDKIVDIGTGSGNIPVMLKKLNKSLDVYATDISYEALKVAKSNAHKHRADVKFLHGDALAPLIERQITVNGLISNPPYIDRKDVNIMTSSVVRYEPDSALFAEDNGLAIYKSILEDLPLVLNKNAKVVFEIGFDQGETLKSMIKAMYSNIDVKVFKDINNNDRIISFNW
ncbi:peptide chain release factor N(5)-glutamine methyltransferase [Staphylococcus durrellii]|uniref:peptide chain release factor N(5)-glutamine methyltransferase n=1 Tax=Staphylococcus durrellii TaxID=2781773 RepID=UPI00189C9737|nr:peptide chain release factor N(5)-glutamine methyltransferase [Staphylococcus durrellii]MBF7016564.1 peptide chain release factor N(5)-glutamine methyltransferase [Staphylococcus durrellii]